MKIEDKIEDKKLQYNIIKKLQKNQQYHMVELINMNMLQVKKYHLLIKLD